MTTNHPIPLYFTVTIWDGPRPLLICSDTEDREAVYEAVDQINRHKPNCLRKHIEGDNVLFTYNGHRLLTAPLPAPESNPERAHIIARLVHHMKDLRASVQVSTRKKVTEFEVHDDQ